MVWVGGWAGGGGEPAWVSQHKQGAPRLAALLASTCNHAPAQRSCPWRPAQATALRARHRVQLRGAWVHLTAGSSCGQSAQLAAMLRCAAAAAETPSLLTLSAATARQRWGWAGQGAAACSQAVCHATGLHRARQAPSAAAQCVQRCGPPTAAPLRPPCFCPAGLCGRLPEQLRQQRLPAGAVHRHLPSSGCRAARQPLPAGSCARPALAPAGCLESLLPCRPAR